MAADYDSSSGRTKVWKFPGRYGAAVLRPQCFVSAGARIGKPTEAQRPDSAPTSDDLSGGSCRLAAATPHPHPSASASPCRSPQESRPRGTGLYFYPHAHRPDPGRPRKPPTPPCRRTRPATEATHASVPIAGPAPTPTESQLAPQTTDTTNANRAPQQPAGPTYLAVTSTPAPAPAPPWAKM